MVANNSLAVQLNLHVGNGCGGHHIVRRNVAGAHHAKQGQRLTLTIHFQLLDSLNHQIAIWKHLADARRQQGSQTSLPVGGTLAGKG